MEHLKKTLILVTSLMFGTVVMHELHLAPWPAFLAVIFYFIFDFDNSKLKMIFGGSVVGLGFAYAFSFILPALIASFGPSLGYYIVLAVSLVIVLGLGAIAHDYFNPITFAYGLLGLLYVDIARESSIVWLLTLLLGGGFVIFCVNFAVRKVIPKALNSAQLS
ncbi:hypothetical protein [Vibrio sp. CAU 1672]|uniref:hypothetical protein n=1 Tax=Vibrio sp. CAU 1672 TaxID=3032594 RepID=UPI0023DC7B30|nr:hypothetical protein [Vibrio sp. CAU 1672]MDF2152816.1 hypothetical protein [Vibrio sp. CAU 1672]